MSVVALVGCFVVAGALAVGLWRPLRDQLLVSVSRRSTPFTELYFANPEQLPAAVDPGVTYRVPYTIVNRTGHTTHYSVTTDLVSGENHVRLGTESVALPDGDRTTRTVSVVPPAPHSAYEIVIRLGGGETIHWRMASR